ncbi:N-acetyltransferase [Eubacteriales bacterium OttesenSCG-928-M02]|nr:N-acetyltransferase [Eubacteriales bacterium OttesenSCG-928-M02]
MTIREERKEEFPAIYRLVQEAFSTARVSDGDEQDFVDALRESGNYIPDLALVAEEDEKLIGHIMFTRIPIETPGEDPIFIGLLLAPLCVALEYRDKGVGKALVEEGFSRAQRMGYTAVFLAGDPGYYGRFGFQKSTAFGIACDGYVPEENCLACEIIPGGLDGITGLVPM